MTGWSPARNRDSPPKPKRKSIHRTRSRYRFEEIAEVIQISGSIGSSKRSIIVPEIARIAWMLDRAGRVDRSAIIGGWESSTCTRYDYRSRFEDRLIASSVDEELVVESREPRACRNHVSSPARKNNRDDFTRLFFWVHLLSSLVSYLLSITLRSLPLPEDENLDRGFNDRFSTETRTGFDEVRRETRTCDRRETRPSTTGFDDQYRHRGQTKRDVNSR